MTFFRPSSQQDVLPNKLHKTETVYLLDHAMEVEIKVNRQIKIRKRKSLPGVQFVDVNKVSHDIA